MHARPRPELGALAARVDQVRRDDPIGYAVLLAADDWHRVMPDRFVPADRLLAQARRQLRAGRPELTADDARLSAAVAAVSAPPPLLERGPAGDYRVTCVDGESVVPPDEPRRAAPLADLTPLELIDLANRRRAGRDSPAAAVEHLYRLAAGDGDDDTAALAELGLADFTLERQELELARQRYATVVAREHPDASPRARLALAEISAAEGDLDGAGRQALAVADTVHPELRLPALELVCELQWELGRWEDALATLRRAVDPADPLGTPALTLRLARMLVVQGRPAEALAEYEALLLLPAVGGPLAAEYVTSALLVGAGGRARAALSRLLDPAEPLTFGPYALALVELLLADRDHDAAAALLARIDNYPGRRPVAGQVQREVFGARLAALTGDTAAAVRAFSRLADTDEPERREAVRQLLIAEGLRLRAAGDHCPPEGFRPVLEFLTESADPEDAAWATYCLGRRAMYRNRLAVAEDTLRQVARYGDTEVLPTALAAIAQVRQRSGDHRGAVAHCLGLIGDGSAAAAVEALHVATMVLVRLAADGPADPVVVRRLREEVRERARIRIEATEPGEDLGHLAYALGVFDSVPETVGGCAGSATEMFELAADAGPPQLAAAAWLQAGILREELGQPLRAVAAYQRAVGTETGAAGESALRLAALARRLGDDDLALEGYGAGLEHGSARVFAESAFAYALAVEATNPDDAEAAYWAVREEPGADPYLVGRALARLGALYLRFGNRRLAERIWRRARRDARAPVGDGYTAERRTIGRVRRSAG